MARRRRKNPVGIPMWMWLAGAGAAYWWWSKNKAVDYGGAVPGEPQPSPEEIAEKAKLLEGMGYICHWNRM